MREFVQNFVDEFTGAIKGVFWKDVAEIAKLIHATYEHEGRVFTIGNGGSSAVASHFANDLNKTVLGHKGNERAKRFQAICLADNTPVLTAWANDVGFEQVFAEQLKNFMQGKDLLFAISSSGNSPNIIRAVEVAKARQAVVVGLTGFSGGKLKELADTNLHIPVNDYVIVESAHDTFCHLLTRYFTQALLEEGEEGQKIEEKKVIALLPAQPDFEIQPLLDLMKNVGKKLLGWRKDLNQQVVEYKKNSKEVVSEIDRRAEIMIKEEIKKLHPDWSFQGEEFGKEGENQQNTVIIDPIDGTKNYLSGSPLFATQIAGVSGEKINWGIIYLPALDELFWAVKGKGAFLNGQPIRVSRQDKLELALQCFGLGHEAENIINLPAAIKSSLAEPRSLGSAGVHFAFLATGRIDIYLASEAGFYDIAPGLIIVKEAGGRIEEIPFDDKQLGKILIVGNPHLTEEAKRSLTDHLASSRW